MTINIQLLDNRSCVSKLPQTKRFPRPHTKFEKLHTAHILPSTNDSNVMCQVHLVHFGCGDQQLYKVTWCIQFVSWTKKEVAKKCGDDGFDYEYIIDRLKDRKCDNCIKWGGIMWRSRPGKDKYPAQILPEGQGYVVTEEWELADGTIERIEKSQSLRRLAPPLFTGPPALALSDFGSDQVILEERAKHAGQPDATSEEVDVVAVKIENSTEDDTTSSNNSTTAKRPHKRQNPEEVDDFLIEQLEKEGNPTGYRLTIAELTDRHNVRFPNDQRKTAAIKRFIERSSRVSAVWN